VQADRLGLRQKNTMPNTDSLSAKQTKLPQPTLGEHFIPLRKADLVRLLADKISQRPEQRAKFLELSRLLSATFHFEYHDRLEQLKDSYAPFDPDSDTIALRETDRSPEQKETFFEQLICLQERANFCRLDRAQIEQSIAAASAWGIQLDVDFEAFDRLEVFVRGQGLLKHSRRRLRNFQRRETVSIPTFRRLIVAFSHHETNDAHNVQSSDQIHLKFFKEIPHADLEMLLPGARMRMSAFDRFRIMLPTLSGIAMTIIKIIKGALVLTFAGVYGSLAFLGLVGGTIGYGIKSFLGYLRTKDRYQLNLTKNLYYQNLDNNAGVLFRLLDEVEEQEFREAILAYFFLWQFAPEAGWTRQELDQHIETFLQQTIQADVDFEIDDALDKLQRMDLVTLLPSKRLAAVAINDALLKLDKAWDQFFNYHAPVPASAASANLKRSA
jgi:hypothetical protein